MKKAGKMMEVAKELQKYAIDAIAVQEIRWQGEGRIDKKEFSMIYSGTSENTGQFGTGFLLSKAARNTLLEYENINHRICRIRVKGKFRNITIVSVHAPTEEKEETEKESFYEALEKVCTKVSQHDMLIVLGDFNAKVGKNEDQKQVAGIHTLHEKNNDNGNMMVQFAARNKLYVKSTAFDHKRIHLGTWKIPGREEVNQIDHVLVSSRHMSSVIDVKSCRGPNCDSDHFLVKVKVRERIANVMKGPKHEVKRWATENLSKNKELQKKYVDVLNSKLTQETDGMEGRDQTPEEIWTVTEKAILEAAKETIGEKRKTRNEEWFDEECMNIIDQKNDARKKMLQRNTRGNEERYHKARKEANKLLRKKKKEAMIQQMEEIEQLSKQNESRKFYAAVNRMRKGFQPKTSGCRSKDGQLLGEEKDIMERWAEHFEELLNEKERMILNDKETMEKEDHTNEDDLSQTPTIEEVAERIRRMKNNKAPGEDGITAELLKNGGQMLIKEIHELIKAIWKSEKMPSKWNIGTICPIFKKGDKLECKNYRGITLLSTAYKIMSSILNERLKKVVEKEIGEYQCGFRTGRGTADQLFVIRQTMEKCHEYGIDLHMLFVDFKEAFDSVNRKALIKALDEMNVPRKLIKLITMTMSSTKAKVKIGNKVSNVFDFNKGVKQGDGLSSTLFIIALHMAVKHVDQRGTIFTKSSQTCAYADDIALIARTKEKLIEIYKELEKRARDLGLVVNVIKTKYMILSSSESRRKPQNLIIDGKEFEGVKKFKYLGNLIDNEARTTTSIKDRIQTGNAAYYANLKLIKSRLISRKTKLQIYKTLIRPIVTYGGETWTMTENDKSMLRRFERKIIRRIFGAIKENGEWRIRNNGEIDKILEQEDIVRFIKSQRIQWLGHVSRMKEERMPKRIMKAKVLSKRKRGRPGLRWQDEVEKDLRVMNVSGWKEKTMDRTGWRRVVLEAKAHPGL